MLIVKHNKKRIIFLLNAVLQFTLEIAVIDQTNAIVSAKITPPFTKLNPHINRFYQFS